MKEEKEFHDYSKEEAIFYHFPTTFSLHERTKDRFLSDEQDNGLFYNWQVERVEEKPCETTTKNEGERSGIRRTRRSQDRGHPADQSIAGGGGDEAEECGGHKE